MESISEPLGSVTFGRFQVLPHRRELLADGQPIKIGGRAFDVLMALIEAPGAVVSRDALMARIWPDRIVEENNLEAQIVALRKAFRWERGLIRTVTGRGYQFTGEIRLRPANIVERTDAGMTPTDLGSALPPTNLPEPVSELIGRRGELREALSLVADHRLVTLTGAGGIGKTRLALAAAHQLLPDFADGVWLAEFAPLTDPGLVPATVAAAVGLELPGGVISAQRVAQALAGRRLLLVLDNCEHLIDAAAGMAEPLLRTNPALHLIATSREPLKVDGEWVYPVPGSRPRVPKRQTTIGNTAPFSCS
jgi:DNA-binding winged helix-turn-helix (wHTH) protein